MEHSFSSMSEDKLLKEYMLLSKVRENLESLSVYNPQFEVAIKNVESDLQKIKGQLFFRYKHHKRINLGSIVFTGSDLQSRMEKYLYNRDVF